MKTYYFCFAVAALASVISVGFSAAQQSPPPTQQAASPTQQTLSQPAAESTAQPAAQQQPAQNLPDSYFAPEIMVNPYLVDPNEAKLPGKVGRYVMLLMDRYDTNTDGKLQRDEWSKMYGSPQAIDLDADGIIMLDEMTYHVADYGLNYWNRLRQPVRSATVGKSPAEIAADRYKIFHPVTSKPEVQVTVGPDGAVTASSTVAGQGGGESDGDAADPRRENDAAVEAAAEALLDEDSPWLRKYYKSRSELQGLPAWFIVRDADGDGQVSVIEYAPNTESYLLAQFGKMDRNNDGILSPNEVRGR